MPVRRSKAAKRLHAYIKEHNLSMGQMGRDIGRATSQISRYLSGQQLPDIGSALAMQDLWDIPAKEWLE